jgi:hypothetical protein
MKKKTSKNLKKNKRRSIGRSIKGGHIIPNYSINTYQVDPNYTQIASRQVLQYGSGKTNKKTNKKNKVVKKGGGFIDYLSSNPITQFINGNSSNFLYQQNLNNSSTNPMPYVQPVIDPAPLRL